MIQISRSKLFVKHKTKNLKTKNKLNFFKTSIPNLESQRHGTN